MRPARARMSSPRWSARRSRGLVSLSLGLVAGSCVEEPGSMMKIELYDSYLSCEISLYECVEPPTSDPHGPALPLAGPPNGDEIESLYLYDTYFSALIDFGERDCVEVGVEVVDAEPTTKVAMFRGFPLLNLETLEYDWLDWRPEVVGAGGTVNFAMNLELNPLLGIDIVETEELQPSGLGGYCVPYCVSEPSWCSVFLEPRAGGSGALEVQEVPFCGSEPPAEGTFCYIDEFTGVCEGAGGNLVINFFDARGIARLPDDMKATAECEFQDGFCFF